MEDPRDMYTADEGICMAWCLPDRSLQAFKTPIFAPAMLPLSVAAFIGPMFIMTCLAILLVVYVLVEFNVLTRLI